MSFFTGNMSLFEKASNLWMKLKEKLVLGKNIGSELDLRCENHPDEMISASDPNDFYMQSPEGGCRRMCGASLSRCEHRCPRTCHIIDTDHSKIDCKKPCPKKLCFLNHPCPLLCYQKCEKCVVPVDVKLACGHVNQVPCSLPPNEFKCPSKVNKKLLKCNHVVEMSCFENPSLVSCPENCDVILSCLHQCKRKCHTNDDPDHQNYDCYEKCDRTPLNCNRGHPCPKKCFESCEPCKALVPKTLTCGHTAPKVECGIPVKDVKCGRKCEKKLNCSHYCPNKCGEPCGPCQTKVKTTVPGCNHEIEVSH